MLDSLLSLVPGGQLTVIAGAVLTALAGVWRVWASGKNAGRNEERAKQAEARNENLDRIKRAAGAEPDSLRDDPRNRDRD